MAKQAHDLGVRKRKLSEPIRRAAILKRLSRKVARREAPDWYKVWLRTNRYPSAREYREWEQSLGR